MTSFRKLLLVTASAVVLCGVQACSSGTELNPQPLPPGTETRDPDQKGDNNGGSSGSSGLGSTPGGGSSDAGVEGGDASDAGDH